ncbi:hypothetical protein GALMADRAFT_139404 [Galerina marginata CBS 339.88]|uniref:RBR-type E3 ubiquitin transferase n=1 Tax=Galerina marginata (strain CBS 339.88) TaxID=685588 RepID=A0A067T2G2_GALM3|nr:hypothetical protein GALMADRAFT_139404 [Galerina marginata CBS 339.88]
MSTPGQPTEHAPPSQRSSQRRRRCHLSKQGNCRFGTSCKFQHDVPDQLITIGNSSRETNKDRGSDRPESITTAGQATTSENTNVASTVHKRPNNETSKGSNKSDVICRDWNAGGCKRGAGCRYLHQNQPHSQAEVQLYGDGADPPESPGPKNHRRGRGRTSQKGKNRALNHADQEAEDQVKRRAEAAKIEADLREQEEKIAREQAEREAQEQARRIEEFARMESERRANAVRLARERAERRAEERQRKAREKAAEQARAKIERQERIRRAEAERKRKEAEKLAKEKEAEEAAKRRQIQVQAQRAREAAVVEQYVVLDSSLVTCGAGLEIWHVVTGFDLCKVTIKNLPRDTKRTEIACIFLHLGIQQSDFFISQLKSDEAVVLVKADHHQAIASGLEGTLLRNQILKFSVSASGNGMDAATHNSPFIHVYWRAPSEGLVATYGTMAEARDKAQTLNMSTWQGRKITASMNERPRGVHGARNYVPSSVRVTSLPSGVQSTDTDLVEFIGTRNIRMLKPILFDLPRSFQKIREYLANYPGIRMNTFETLDSGENASGEAKIKVQFDEWEDAKNAYAAIRNLQSGANSAQFRSWFPPNPLQYSIKIPRAQYEAQKRQWDALSEKKPGSDTCVEPKIGDRGDVVFLRVLGQDRKATGPLKVRVENMVAGEKLDATYWHSSFGSTGGRSFFDRIYREKNAFVRNDFKTRSLRVYGEPSTILEVCEIIKSEVDRLSKSETTRILDQASIGFFVREGLGKLTELLGKGNATLNLASGQCKITVKGGEEAIHHLQRLIDESRNTTSLGAFLPDPAEREACPICTDDVSNPEQLGCGHTYCAGCLKHFLMSAAETRNFPLICIANDATCAVPISIPFIQRFLPAQAFESLVEAAFLSYLDQHPQELKYCTTPDCKQIYRHRTDPTVLQCPSCFLTICAACGEDAHEDMTCEQHQFHKNPNAEHWQERLNQQLALAHGYKKCPQCKTWIEKIGGCDHMECRCGAHICWICMVIFGREDIHEHMQNVHENRPNEVAPESNLGNMADNGFMADQVDDMAMIERLRNGVRQSSTPYIANWVNSDEQLPAYDWQMEAYRQRLEQQRRQAEDVRRAEEQSIAERRRLAQERMVAYQRRMAEETRVAEEARNLRRMAEEMRVAEEARKLAERRRLDEERVAAYQRQVAENTRRQRLREDEDQRSATYERQVAENSRRQRLREDEDQRRADYQRLVLEETRKREEKKGWCTIM